MPDLAVGLGQVLLDEPLVAADELEGGHDAVLVQESRGVRADAPDLAHGQFFQVEMDLAAGDHGQAVGFVVLRSDLGQHLGQAHPGRDRDAQFLPDGRAHLFGDRFIRAVKASPQPGQVHEGLVDGVLLDIGRKTAQDLEHADREEAVGLVVGGEDHSIRAELFHVPEPHTAGNPPGLGLVAGRRHNAALLAGHDGPAAQLGVDGLLAGREERVAVDVHDGPRPGGEGEELIVHIVHLAACRCH